MPKVYKRTLTIGFIHTIAYQQSSLCQMQKDLRLYSSMMGERNNGQLVTQSFIVSAIGYNKTTQRICVV